MATVQTKEDKVVENITATPKIDVNVEINIPRSAIPFDETKHKYKCTSCGKGFTKQQGNFQKTNDVLYQANGGYLPWCKECTDRYVEQVTALFSNNEEHAMRDFCQRAGWNYDISALVASRETYSGHRDRSRISHYAAKKNLNCGGRKTYVDQAGTSAAGMDRGRCGRDRQKRLREKQERLEKSEEFRIKQLHFADNEGIMSEEIGSDESYDRKAVSESRWQV